MASITTLKNAFSVFTRKQLPQVQLQAKDCFLFNNIRKVRMPASESYRVPVEEAGGQVSHTFVPSQTYGGDPEINRFVIESDNLKEFYRNLVVTNKAIRAMKADPTMGVTRHIKRAVTSVQEVTKEIERELFRDASSSLGTVSAVGATTATMTIPSNAKYIRPGAGLVGSATSTGALIDGGAVAVVESVNPISGVVTFDAALSGTLASLTATNHLFYAGSAAAGSTVKGLVGLDAYATGGTIHGVTTSQNPSVYQLLTTTGQLTDIQKALTDADAFGWDLNGTMRDTIVLNALDFARFADTTTQQVQYAPGKGAAVGFEFLTVHGASGAMKVVSSPFCPRSTGYLLKMDSLELVYLPDNVVNLDDIDGKESNRQAAAAANEWRVESYCELGITTPGANIQVTFS